MRVHRQGLQRVLAIGRAFHELQLEAMGRSHSNRPTGGPYARAYAALEMPVPDLVVRNRMDRSQYIWCYQHRAALEAWWALSENAEQKDRWNHPDAIQRNYRAYEAREKARTAPRAAVAAAAGAAAASVRPNLTQATQPAAGSASAPAQPAERPILNPRRPGDPPRTAEASKPEPAPQPEPQPTQQQAATPRPDVAALQAQIRTLTKERDAAIMELDSAVQAEQRHYRPLSPGGLPPRMPSIEAMWRGRGADIRRLTKELAAARAAHGLGQDTEAAIGKLSAERDKAISERDAARTRIAALEAQLAGDDGETAKLVRQNKILLGRARNTRRAASANPAAIEKRNLRKLQFIFHPDGAARREAMTKEEMEEALNEAMQIFNALELRVYDD